MRNFLFLVFISFFIKINYGQQVQLTTTFCNTNIASLGTNFYWTTNGAEQYRVRISEGINTWTYAPGFTSTGYPKTFTNLIFAGVNPQYNTTYIVQVDYMIGGVWQNNWGNPCTLTTPTFTGIQLESTYCGATLPSLTSIFRAQTVSGGTTWRFRVTNTVDGSVKVVDKGSSYGSTNTRRTTSINELASLPGTGTLTTSGQSIYTVECAVSVQNGPFSSYGTLCNVTITQSLSPTIVSTDCGIEHNYIFQDFLDANPPSPSTGCTYQFRLVDQSTLSVLESAVVSVPKVKIYDIPGYAYNKTYSASVRCIRQGIIGNYGPACILYTENQPYTKIQDGQFSTIDNCDIQITSFAQRIYAFAIPGGKYEFEINNGQNTYLHRTNNIRNFRLSEVSGYVNVYNTLHHIRVRVSMDNYTTFGPWNESCWAKTPIAIAENEPGITNQSEYLQLTIYPNPSENNFSLKYIDEDLLDNINLSLYDFNGKLIFEKIISNYELNQFTFGEDLQPGFYQMTIKDNSGILESFKLLKTK
jgi:hypothetical protein